MRTGKSTHIDTVPHQESETGSRLDNVSSGADRTENTGSADTPVARWRVRMRQARGRYNQRLAAAELGVSLPAYQAIERGRTWEGEPLEPDRRTCLACAALEAGIAPIK